MTEVEVGQALLVALRHPLRREILKTMARRAKASPREVADILGSPLSNTSYHVRVLLDCDAVELVDQAQVRGSVQHFYRVAIKEPWALSALGLQP